MEGNCYIYSNIPCPVCEGRGYRKMRKKCERCDGTGKAIVCENCLEEKPCSGMSHLAMDDQCSNPRRNINGSIHR